MKLLRNPEGEANPTAEDKLRLVIVFYLSVPESAVTKDDIAELEKELKGSGADISAFEYVRRTREISKMSVPGALGGASTPVMGGQQAGELFRGFGALGNRVSGCLTSSIHASDENQSHAPHAFTIYFVLLLSPVFFFFVAHGPLAGGWT